MKRLKRLIKNKEAYIVGGVPTTEDIRLSDLLNIPYYGCVDESRKITGSNGINFMGNIGLPIPLGITGITDENDLYKEWIPLILSNRDIDTWIFKIDHESEGDIINYR